MATRIIEKNKGNGISVYLLFEDGEKCFRENLPPLKEDKDEEFYLF